MRHHAQRASWHSIKLKMHIIFDSKIQLLESHYTETLKSVKWPNLENNLETLYIKAKDLNPFRG